MTPAEMKQLSTAAQLDLADLVDPVGLQTTILRMVADGNATESYTRIAASKCEAAYELRRALETIDYTSGAA